MKLRIRAVLLAQCIPVLETALQSVMAAFDVKELSREAATHVKLVAQNGRLSLSSDNPQSSDRVGWINEPSWLYFTCDAQIEKEGSFLVPANEFIEFIRKVSKGARLVQMECVGARLRINASNQAQVKEFAASPVYKRGLTKLLDKLTSQADPDDELKITFCELELATVLRLAQGSEPGYVWFCFENGSAKVGKNSCEARHFSGALSSFRFTIAHPIVRLLLSLLIEDREIVFRVALPYQYGFEFNRRGIGNYFVHWFACP